MVDESATATQLFNRLRDQRADNLLEGARLADRLLREFPDRLVPASEGDPDLFRAVRLEVESILRSDPELAAAFADLATIRADRLLDAGELEETFRTALWTPAGLEAGLRLAQLDAESGLGHRSLRRLGRLEGHPGLADESARSRRDRVTTLARWVAEGKGPEALGAWPAEDRAADPFGADPENLSTEAWSELWRESLPDSPYERAFRESRRSGRPTSRTAERIVADGSLLVVMPAADAERIYFNEGHVVRAIDRLSRRERWSTPIDPTGGQELGAIGDPTLVALQGDRVVTLSGHALGNRRTGSGHVVCLDRETGHPLWTTDLAAFAAGLSNDRDSDDLFPYGVVAVDSDAVFVMARRVTNRLETIDYLASLDLEDGRVRWLVPLGSCGGVRLGGTRPYASPVASEGRVLVAASVGVIASVDAADGSIDWLRREAVPLREGRYSTEPWELSQPLLVADRVLSMAPDQTAILELDARTGARLARHGTSEIAAAQPRYLLGAELRDRRIVLAIGSDVVAYDATDLDSPLWRYAERNRDVLAGDPGVANRNGLRGRVQVVGDALLVPGGEALRIVDLESGRIRRTLDWSEAANVLSTDGQIVFVATESIASVMDPNAARVRLTARLATAPSDPEWPIAMMDLEIASGHREAAIEAAELALAAVERSGDAAERDRLFERLIDFDLAVRRDREFGTRVRDLLAAVAIEPGQRVRERLSRGDWHVDRGEFGDAIEVWQSLLSEPTLGHRSVSENGRDIAVRVAARERMRDLAEVHGDGLLAPGAALADLRLDRLLESGASAAELLAVAAEFPLTEAAGRARLEAADRLERSGQPFEATLSRLAEVRAAVEAAAGDLDPSAGAAGGVGRAGQGVLAERLDAMVERERSSAPRLGRTPGMAVEWPGRLVEFAPSAGDLRDLVLLADEGEMQRLRTDGPELTTVWSVPIEDPSPLVVGATAIDGRETLLVWQNVDRRQPIAMAVDAARGEVPWLNPSVSTLFPTARPEGAGASSGRRTSSGTTRGGQEDPEEILPALVGDRLVLVRRSGDLVALDASDGATVRWTLEGVMDRVQLVEPGPLGVLIAGESRAAGGLAPVVALISREGRIVRRWELDAAPEIAIRWVRQTPLGEVIWGSDDGISWNGLLPGDGTSDDRWSLRQPQIRHSAEAWPLAGRLIVREGSDRLSVWRTRDGRGMAQAGDLEREGASNDRTNVQRFEQLLIDSEGRAAAIFGNRLMVLDVGGEILGLDAVHEDRNYLLAGLASDGAVVLSFEGAGPVIGDDGTPRTEFTYAIYRFGLADGGRQLAPALELRTLGPRFDAIRIEENWILLSSPASTVAIPFR